MKIIPVIDILCSRVVHAVAGERHLYRPIKSTLVDKDDPLEVARAFKERLRRDTLYVADLDAIMGSGNNIEVVKRVRQTLNLKVMIDAGVSSFNEAEKIIKQGFDYVVLGTETLQELNELKEIVGSAFGERVIASLDIKLQKTVSKCGRLKGLNPVEAAKTLHQLGVERLIVLELDKVGTLQGPNLELLREVCKTPFEEVLVGGGVRGKEDLVKLATLNVKGVLVATALHNGSLKLEDLLEVES